MSHSNPTPDPASLRQQARGYLNAGDLHGARKIYRHLSRSDPGPDVWLALGQIHMALDELSTATDDLRQAARARPLQADITAGIADLQFELGLVAESLETLRQAVAELPDNPRLQLLLAQALEDLGLRDEAMTTYQKALALAPRWSAALGGLLRVAREDADIAWVNQAHELLGNKQLPPDERAVLGYGLGRVYERQGKPDEAFSAWQQANRLRREVTGKLNQAAASAHIDAQIQRYSTRILNHPPTLRHPDRTPVFIVGMPRSGTTLVEQMLAAHPDASGYGELPSIARIAARLNAAGQTGQSGTTPASTGLFPEAAMQQAVDTYYGELARRGDARSPFAVDKAPLNFFHAGLISLLFPHGKIIVCQRDPRDVCLSIYAENFGLGQAFATDLDDLVCFYREYRRLVAYWRQALPAERIREVHYERLVSNPESELKPLLSWLGMSWDEACLAFHRQSGAVLTPSKWQVRSPLYRSSVGRWKKYRAHIAPLLSAFGEEDNPRE